MHTQARTITIALAGNPNSGKTTVFNGLTGSRQHVGNYPGVTVEKKEGWREHGGHRIKIVDLPGTYSLTAHSIEELIARNFVIEEKPDVIVDIIDATNLERNLYLAVQFIELGVPLVLAMNMTDLAKARGCEIDHGQLSVLLGAAVVPTVATKGEGMGDLLDAVVRIAAGEQLFPPVTVKYGREIEEEIDKLVGLFEACPELDKHYSLRWLAVKLLENDSEVRDKVRRECPDGETVLAAVERSGRHLEAIFGDVPEIVIADRRYGFISGACRESVRTTVQSRYDMSERIDSILTNRIIGLPLFFGLMYLVFQFTFAFGEPAQNLIGQFFTWLARMVSALWPPLSESALKSLLVDGVIGGVGSVLSFLPNIMLLFVAIAVLEDSGYMARAAFIMDRLMHKVGLHGKSFIPMLIGFGCSVPAIMATRTLENRTDRLTTILIIPLMSCGARLTVYALIIPAFFAPAWRAPVLWAMYLIGILLAMVGARVIRSTLLRGEATPFVMELPPYRMPTIRGVLIHMWERSSLYVRKAGTIILGISIVLWVLTTYPKSKAVEEQYAQKAVDTQQTYLNEVRTLNTTLGLPADAEILVRIARAETDEAMRQTGLLRQQTGAKGTPADTNKLIRELREGTHGDVLTRFLEARKALEELAERPAGPLGPDSRETPPLSPEKQAAREAAGKYLREIKTPFDESLAKLQQEKRAKKLSQSAAGRIGHALEPALKPLGFDWRIGTAFLGAFAAKEVFVAQMGIVFSVEEAETNTRTLGNRLRQNYAPFTAFCVMLFALVSTPCVATVAVTKKEAGSWKWALLQFGGLTALAYTLTLVVYQVGSLFT